MRSPRALILAAAVSLAAAPALAATANEALSARPVAADNGVFMPSGSVTANAAASAAIPATAATPAAASGPVPAPIPASAGVAAVPPAGDLLTALGQAGVSPQQALGGAGALFGLARNRLTTDEYAQLSQAVPGLDLLTGNPALGMLGGLGGLGALLGQPATAAGGAGVTAGEVQSMQDVTQAFGALGMDGGMVGRFAPAILQFLGQQGIANTVLQSLGNLWGVGGGLSTAPATAQLPGAQ